VKIATRFSVATHILSLLELTKNEDAPTSEWMAGSVGVNAVIVRNITGQLKRAGLVDSRQGVAGARLAKPLTDVTLLDVYRAVEMEDELFAIHENPNPDCPVGANIQATLESVFREAQHALEDRLGQTRLDQVVTDLTARANP